jgi:hypothetical protein
MSCLTLLILKPANAQDAFPFGDKDYWSGYPGTPANIQVVGSKSDMVYHFLPCSLAERIP